MLDLLDGLMLAGGADIDPASYGAQAHPETVDTVPERDRFEIALVRAAIERDLPVLGICRGMQLINVASAARCSSTCPSASATTSTGACAGTFDGADHDVELRRGLACGARGRRDPSRHQVPPPPGRRPPRRGPASSPAARRWTACPRRSSCPDRRFVLGVQWHPEADPAARHRARGRGAARARAAVADAPRARRRSRAAARSGARRAARRGLAVRPARAADRRERYTPRRVRLSRAIRATAWGMVAAGVRRRSCASRVQRRRSSPQTVAFAAPVGPVRRGAPLAHPRRGRRAALQMWAYLAAYKTPHDDERGAGASACTSTTRSRSTACSGSASCRRVRLQRALARGPAARWRALDSVLVWAHWSGSSCRTARSPTSCCATASASSARRR